MSRGIHRHHRHFCITALTILRSLKRELVRAQEEIKRIQSVPLVIGQFMEAIDQKCVLAAQSKMINSNPGLALA